MLRFKLSCAILVSLAIFQFGCEKPPAKNVCQQFVFSIDPTGYNFNTQRNSKNIYQYGFVAKAGAVTKTSGTKGFDKSEIPQKGIFWVYQRRHLYFDGKPLPIKRDIVYIFPGDGTYRERKLTAKEIEFIEKCYREHGREGNSMQLKKSDLNIKL